MGLPMITELACKEPREEISSDVELPHAGGRPDRNKMRDSYVLIVEDSQLGSPRRSENFAPRL